MSSELLINVLTDSAIYLGEILVSEAHAIVKTLFVGIYKDFDYWQSYC